MAAPMAGVGLRVVITTTGDAPIAMFNPAVVSTAGPEREGDEANLSLPGLRAPVARPHCVTVAWQSVNTGKPHQATFEGWDARVLLHEIEILDGRLFVDHASAPPVGTVLGEHERARQATGSIFGEALETFPPSERFGLALLPPALHGLDGVLTRPTVEVDHEAFPRERLRTLVDGMMQVLHAEGGVGLAGPQVGLGLRIAAIDSGEDAPLVLINPSIIDRDEREATGTEGCLSVPGWRGEVRRSTAVKIRTDTVDNDTVELDLSAYLARIAQHEIDHLDGVLFTQRMDPEAKLQVIDAETLADDLVHDLERRETQDSRRSADQAKPGKASATRRNKRGR
jgi:peptide deformylase